MFSSKYQELEYLNKANFVYLVTYDSNPDFLWTDLHLKFEEGFHSSF